MTDATACTSDNPLCFWTDSLHTSATQHAISLCTNVVLCS